MMNFVLALHSHLPWVLHHGRWPHGSDWLCEAALDTYLPLLEALEDLEREGVPAPLTLGITPVLAAQLAHPAFAAEMRAFLAHRIEACDVAPASLAATGDGALVPLAAFWRERLTRLGARFERADGNLVTAFGALEARGRLEIMSSAATHGFLPLLGRDESIRLQLLTGRAEHRRLFGRDPAGCWLPECAFRPAGPWAPAGARASTFRQGTDAHLTQAGFRYVFVDAHQASAGESLGQYLDVPLGTERFDAERHGEVLPVHTEGPAARSPLRVYRVNGKGRTALAAFVRDPDASMQVWSRRRGYPGDGTYLEFHKIRWPGGLKLWRVTDPEADLGAKQAYDPAQARARAGDHARHFAGVLAATRAEGRGAAVIAAPFDTELFGHWWFEGVDFLADLFRALPSTTVQPVTAGGHVTAHPPRAIVRLAEGSWGAGGDYRMWLNHETAWTWRRLWPLEDAFWAVAGSALSGEPQRAILAQAARSLLLSQASDWQFIISTGAAADYAELRFNEHCEDAERLVAALAPQAPEGALEAAQRRALELRARDDLFPDVLTAVAAALR
ncbi:MAG: 1,4-alpha-glucan branching protein domain-containing protein [Gemmatimonadales bacterium]